MVAIWRTIAQVRGCVLFWALVSVRYDACMSWHKFKGGLGEKINVRSVVCKERGVAFCGVEVRLI